MIRHLFKLVWNRKRTSALLILEIFFSFLVVFVVGDARGCTAWDNYQRPLGFSIENVWQLRHRHARSRDDQHTPERVGDVRAPARGRSQSLEAVEAAAGAMGAPYELGSYRAA